MEQIQKLVKELHKANEAYRAGTPIMTDREYDELEHQLSRLDPNNDWFTRGVHEKAPKNRKQKLPFAMMSLNKVKTVEELLAWADRFDSSLIITPKLDGLSVGIKNRGLQAFTRGDGQIGQDCTKHLSAVSSCLNTDKLQEDEVIRGEVIFTNKDFAQFKTLHPEAKNSRNSATGLINGDFDVSKKQEYECLSFMAYSILGEGMTKEEQLQHLNALNQSGTKMPFIVCKKLELKALSKDREEFRKLLLNLFNEWKREFPIDGLVFDVNAAELRKGECANGNPEYAIAYKDPDFSEKGETTIDHIELQLNREGVATPVIALSETLNLSGADIQKVNGINMNYVHEWGLLDGQKVTIVRSGEVIPKIVAVGGVDIPFRENFSTDKEYKLAYESALRIRHIQPSYQAFLDLVEQADWACPHCHRILHWDSNHVQMVCPNEECPERRLQTIVQFCKIIGVKNFGEESLRQLFDEGKISDIISLFYLVESDFEGLQGWATASIKSLLTELSRIKDNAVSFAQVAHASGYFGGLGQKTIQAIVDVIGIDENGKIGLLPVEKLCEIEGVQEITAKQFNEGLKRYYESNLCDLVQPSFVVSPKPKEGKLSGMKVCFTGFRDANLKGQIEGFGGEVTDTLTKATNCLITKDINSTSSKIKKAKELGIEVLTPTEFVSKFV